MTNYNYEMQRQTLIDYLQLMVSRADWHGVSDAANDLRVLEAENRANEDAPALERLNKAAEDNGEPL